MADPMTIALALQGVNMLGNLGASYLDRNQQKKAQRELDRRVARANLSRAFGGNPQVAPVEVESTGGAKFLRGIGQGAGIGSQAFSLYGGLQNQAAQNRLRDLQIGNAEMARDKILATRASQAAP